MAELEAALGYREWNMPPRIFVDMDPPPGIASELVREPPFLHPSTDPDDWKGYL